MRYLRWAAALTAGAVLVTIPAALPRLAAQQTTPAPALVQPVQPPPVPDRDRVQLKADHLRYDAAIKKYVLTDKVQYKHQDVTLFCDKSEYDEQNDTGTAIGNLKIVDPESTITGDVVFADFSKEIMTITGNVTIVTLKKRKTAPAVGATPGAAPVAETGTAEYKYKQTTTTCSKIEYHYADTFKIAYISGPVKTTQEDKDAFADKAVYKELDGILIVEGNVRVVTQSGNEFRCPAATISTDDDWMEVQNVEGLVMRKKTEQPATSNAEPTAGPELTPAPPAPAPAPAPANQPANQ